MIQMIVDAVTQAWSNFADGVRLFLPRAVTTLSIAVAGWLIAILLRAIVRRTFGWLHVNAAADRAGVGHLLKLAALPPADVLAGSIVFWIVWLGFLLSGVNVLGFESLQGLAIDFATFVPKLVVAIAIVIVGFVGANFAWRATLLAAVNAKLPSPGVLAGAVRILILILTGAMALEQIAVARTIVLTAFAIAFGAVMLGLAVAFGIGGGGIARRILEHQFPERERRKPDDVSHL